MLVAGPCIIRTLYTSSEGLRWPWAGSREAVSVTRTAGTRRPGDADRLRGHYASDAFSSSGCRARHRRVLVLL